jgi:glycosyltransferase involved in cell wall biosynthesis
LEETVKDISISFPYLNVKVIGNIKSEYPNVGIFESGMLSEEEVNELYQKCRCVIYPSLYEGFGFPVMKSIANRKPVFARGSDLLSEIINKGRKLNGIYSYRDKYELMQLVHDTIDKKEITDEFSGNEVNSGGDWGWDESAESIISFMKKLIDGYSYKKTEARLDHMHVIKTIR